MTTHNIPGGTWLGCRAALFDLDGVLTPTADLHQQAWTTMFNATLPLFGDHGPFTAADYLAHVDGRPRADGVRALAHARGLTIPDDDPAPGLPTVADLAARKDTEFLRLLSAAPLAPYPGVLALLDELAHHDVPVAVVTSSANAHAILTAAGLADRFSTIVDAHTARAAHLAGKPAPDVFVHAAHLLGVEPWDCAVLEDARSGVAAAHAGGFGLVIGVDRGAGRSTLYGAGAHRVIDGLDELVSTCTAPAGPDLVDRSLYRVHPWELRQVRPAGQCQDTAATLFSLGNGHLGVRGTVDGERPGTGGGTYVAGLHHTWPIVHAEDAYGLARLGQSLITAPDTTAWVVTLNGELLTETGTRAHFERALDMRDGVLRVEQVWQSTAGQRVRLRSTRMVSLTCRHLMVSTLEVTVLDGGGVVTVATGIRADITGPDQGQGLDPRRGRTATGVLHPRAHDHDETLDRTMVTYQCASSSMSLACGVDHTVTSPEPVHTSVIVGDGNTTHTWTVDLDAGQNIHVTKYASYHSAAGHPFNALTLAVTRDLNDARSTGLATLHAEQGLWLQGFWSRSDVELPAQAHLQQCVRWSLLQLAHSGARTGVGGIAAKGVSGSGYDGHYFWDTEIYVLPFWTYTDPQVTKDALTFRYGMLPAARQRARELGHAGALFPWRTINGAEASAYYPAGTAQYHINGDIAFAVEQYVSATGDWGFLQRMGIDILVETARMWADLGFWCPTTGRFHIHGVTGPDEYTTVVNDNVFTNLMAKANMLAAARRFHDLSRPQQLRAKLRLNLGDDEIADWERAGAGIFIPFDATRGIHPQDEGFLRRKVWDLSATPPEKFPLMLHHHPLVIYRHQVLKQADLVMALFLRGNEFTPEHKRANFDYYEPLTTGDSTLSAVAQTIIAAEIGHEDLALQHFSRLVATDLADLHHNTRDGVHVAAAGGVWQALVNGFAGLRDHDGIITLDPRLPAPWPELSFRLLITGTRVLVRITHQATHVQALDGPGADLEVHGQPVHLDPGQCAAIPHPNTVAGQATSLTPAPA